MTTRKIRDSKIIDEYSTQGLTLQQLGDKYALTNERIRQILISGKAIKRVPGELAEARFQTFVSQHGEQINQHFNKSRSIEATVTHFAGVYPKAWVRKALQARRGEQVRTRKVRAGTYSNDDLFRILQEKAVNGRLSTNSYNACRTPQDPAVSTFVVRFGSWGSAVRAAGLANGHRYSVPARKWSNDDMIEAVAKYVIWTSGTPSTPLGWAGGSGVPVQVVPTVVGYEKWRKEGSQKVPSFSAIRIQTQMRWLPLLEAARPRIAKAIQAQGK